MTNKLMPSEAELYARQFRSEQQAVDPPVHTISGMTKGVMLEVSPDGNCFVFIPDRFLGATVEIKPLEILRAADWIRKTFANEKPEEIPIPRSS